MELIVGRAADNAAADENSAGAVGRGRTIQLR